MKDELTTKDTKATIDARPQGQWLTTLLVVAVLVGGPLLVFGDVLLGGGDEVIGHPGTDMDGQFLAWRKFGFEQMRQGRLALWNPHVFGGAPFLGGGQSALLYPPNLLFLALPLQDAVNLSVVGHVMLLGWLMYLWMRRRGLSPGSAVLPAAIVMLGGACVPHAYAGHLSNLCTMAWAPLLLLAVDGLLESPALRWPLLGAAAVAMQLLAGHSQYAFYTGVAAGVYFLLRLRGSPRRWGALAGFAGVFVAGAGLAAAQLFTSIDAAAQSVRGAGLPYDLAASFPFPPENVLTAVAGEAFGGPLDEYWGRGIWWEMSLFVGAAAAVLAVYGAIHAPRGRRLVPLAAIVVLVLLAVGNATPLFALLYRHVPGFRQFRGISKFIFPASLFIAMLAGMGLEAWRRRGWVSYRPAVAAAAAAVLVAAAGLTVRLAADSPATAWWPRLVQTLHDEGQAGRPALAEAAVDAARLRSSTSLLAAAGVLGAAGVLLAARKFAPAAAWAVLALALCELLVFARTHTASLDAAKALRPGFCRVMETNPPGDWRVLRTGAHNEPMLGGFDDLWGSDPMVLNRYGEWIAHTRGLAPDEALRIMSFVAVGPDSGEIGPLRLHRMYSMLRLKYALQRGNSIKTVPFPMGRLNLVPEYVVCPDRGTAFAAMDDPAFNPLRTVLLEQAPGIDGLVRGTLPPSAGAPAAAGTVRLVESTSDRLTIEADLPAPAVLLVTDTYARGWRVRASPGSAQSDYRVVPGNYCLRAVPLKAGRHRFVMEYRPAAFRAGAWVSLASLAAYAAGWGWVWRGRRRAGAAA